jgi:hypothetical protein
VFCATASRVKEEDDDESFARAPVSSILLKASTSMVALAADSFILEGA